MHRDQARKFLIGVVTLAVIGLVSYVGATVQGGGEIPGRPYTYVKAAFEDVGMLQPRQNVVQNGVRIGEVHSVAYEDGHAIVTMRLEGQRSVYRDARAQVGYQAAVGKKHVQFDPGTRSAGPLSDTAIPLSQTSASPELDEALSALDKQTREALGSSLVELGGGLGGHSNDLRDAIRAAPGMLKDAGDISGALTSEQADLPSLLHAANQLAGRFTGHEQELSRLVKQVDTTLRAINVDGARPLADTVQALPATLRQARQGLKSLNGPLSDVRSAATTIRPGAQALGAATEDLRGFLRDAVVPLGKVPRVSDQANPAVEDLTRTVDDARPLVPRLTRTLAYSRALLHDLAPYAPDIGRFFSEHDLLSGQIAPDKHYFGFMIAAPGLYSASVPDPRADRVPYPKPGGGAWRDHGSTGGGR
ncbi:MlaD family protein [Haloechinothrix alba]|uniref:MlaD family protein n=1 Tax=Haloechinothrix alba TaxID=664784 RepID=UPI001595A988|nr:MlaD family protein [Haloechinothrix alba]